MYRVWMQHVHRLLAPWVPLLLVLLVGLLLRVALWGNLPRQGFISDEAEYLAAANWLAEGRGFHWHQGWLWTRAPLYPLFLAAHIRLFGMHLAPIYATQVVLSLITVVLVYALARGFTARRGASGAALLAAVYLPFATHPFMLLSETLFVVLLVGAFVAAGWWVQQRQHQQQAPHPSHTTPSPLLAQAWAYAPLVVAGVLLGLATLTRGLTLGFLPLVAAWVWWAGTPTGQRGRERRERFRLTALLSPLILTVVCAGVILPWSVYASRLYGGTILVDTTGAYNLMLGARAAVSPDDSGPRSRDFVLALLNTGLSENERRDYVAKSCLWQQHDPRLLAALQTPVTGLTQGTRQQLMTAEAVCLMSASPGAVFQKSLEEVVRFFQINYTGSERMSNGFALGRLPRWYTLALFLLDDTLYALLVPLAAVGWARAARSEQHAVRVVAVLVGAWWLYILLTTPVLFAINRFRLPFMPFVFVACAALLHQRSPPPRPACPRPTFCVLARVLAVLLALVTLTPYAYLQEPPALLASYLGPYPSSLEATRIAWNTRPVGLRGEQLVAALGDGDTARVRALFDAGGLPVLMLPLARPLLAGLEGDPAAGLAMLPNQETLDQAKDWQAAVVRGDLLRRMGDERGAKTAFTPTYVDDHNPVEWAWEWLHPPPTDHIDLAGNLDLGYIRGFYLGEGDPAAGGTFRWSGPEAWLRFPAQGTGHPLQFCMRADGRGWPKDMPRPHTRVLLHPAGFSQAPQPVATFEIGDSVDVYCATVPPVPPGDDVLIALQSDSFVPNAANLLAQQGPQTGQLRISGVRLDWAELRDEQNTQDDTGGER